MPQPAAPRILWSQERHPTALVIDLTPQQEAGLTRAAAPAGVDPAHYLRRVIDRITSCDGSVELAARGIDEVHAADLRGRLKAFATDWDRPDMDAYDAL